VAIFGKLNVKKEC
jgi:hypothetical protein